jgi:phosphatidate cytidylyltransferase
MLRTRVLTALVLGPLALVLIFAASLQWCGLVFALLMMIGSFEFRRLGDLQGNMWGWIMMAAQAGLFFALLRNAPGVEIHALALLSAACVAWLLMLLRLVAYRPGVKPDFQYRIVSFACALATLTFAWIAMYVLRAGPNGSWWILVMLLVIWSADTGAYFVGRALGKRKLAPRLSPSKTWVGFTGGVLASLLVGLAALHYIPALSAPAGRTIPLIMVTAIVSVGGDLFVSLHKRRTGLKDSGRIFPGHGGVLDRLDSLLASAPFFALGKLLLDI